MSVITIKYDRHFKDYAYLDFNGEVHWHWFRAMGVVESNLNQRAVSPAGAVGIMQLMPATSDEIATDMSIKNQPLDPRTNIRMGIHYARKMWNIFAKEQGFERLCFMLGAYNAGPGNIIKAQKVAARPDVWNDIAAVMPQVTGDHAMETINYVQRVLAIRQQMIGRG